MLGGRTKDGHRVVERLGSGIPAVLDALRLAGLAPPIFHDLGVRFTARVVARTPGQPAESSPVGAAADGLAGGVTEQEGRIVASLRRKPATARQLVTSTGLTLAQVRYALRALRQAAVVHTERLDGRTDRFVLTSTEQATG